ncbi:MAG: dethiobiotin synthase [Thiotrichales bacterium]|nr:dethiobiotin synthase [Thiotrichales bacterium]
MGLSRPSRPKTTSIGGFFITGTDTDVGKTRIAANLAHTLVQLGFELCVRKPVASGCLQQADGQLLAQDALLLKQAANSSETLQKICPWQYAPAISPHLAIAQAGHRVLIRQLAEACQPEKTQQLLLVEGAGGWLSPLASDGFNQDLAQRLGLPVILVIADRLGAINQALLSAQAIRAAGLELYAAVVNQPMIAASGFTEGLESWLPCPLYYQPYSAQPEPQFLTELAEQLSHRLSCG